MSADLMEIDGRRWEAWSTTVHILVTDPERLDEAETITRARLDEIDLAASRFRPDAELALLPDDGTSVVVSDRLAVLIRRALEAAERSDGAVDPTLGSALVAAGYDRDIRALAGQDVRTTAPVTGRWQDVSLRSRELRLPVGVRLDLGATAKAVAADEIAIELAGRLGCGALVNLGGDIATCGAAADWQVTVQDLPGDPSTQVGLAAGWALATSSTQRRTWSAAGRTMHHILDPRTGLPAAPVWRSVSVVAPTALEANMRATATIVQGSEGMHVLESAGRAARLVDRAGRVTLLGGWPDEAAADHE